MSSAGFSKTYAKNLPCHLPLLGHSVPFLKHPLLNHVSLTPLCRWYSLAVVFPQSSMVLHSGHWTHSGSVFMNGHSNNCTEEGFTFHSGLLDPCPCTPQILLSHSTPGSFPRPYYHQQSQVLHHLYCLGPTLQPRLV